MARSRNSNQGRGRVVVSVDWPTSVLDSGDNLWPAIDNQGVSMSREQYEQAQAHADRLNVRLRVAETTGDDNTIDVEHVPEENVAVEFGHDGEEESDNASSAD